MRKTVPTNGAAAAPPASGQRTTERPAAERIEKFFVFDLHSMQETAVEARFRESPSRQAQILPLVRGLANPQRRAIVAFQAEIDGRQKFIQIQQRFRGPERQRVSSFVGFMVDADYLRSTYFPSLIQKRLAVGAAADRFPAGAALHARRRGQAARRCADAAPQRVGRRADVPAGLLRPRAACRIAAPYEERRETWRDPLRLRLADESRRSSAPTPGRSSR